MAPNEVHDLIDKQIHGIVDPWVGSVSFPVYKWEKSMDEVDPITHLDITSCLNGKDKPPKQLYFCPKTYPLPQSYSIKLKMEPSAGLI